MVTPSDLTATFLAGMRRVASTVSVVTSIGPAGTGAATVSSLTSVSIAGVSPSLLVCVNKEGALAARLRINRFFCVNVLGDNQAGLAATFATKGAGKTEQSITQGLWRNEGPYRVLDDCVAAFQCRLRNELEIDSHIVLIGAVERVLLVNDETPLVYRNRSYGSVCGSGDSTEHGCPNVSRLRADADG